MTAPLLDFEMQIQREAFVNNSLRVHFLLFSYEIANYELFIYFLFLKAILQTAQTENVIKPQSDSFCPKEVVSMRETYSKIRKHKTKTRK